MKNTQNILLLNPPDISLVQRKASPFSYTYFEPPLGLLHVHSFLKQARPDLNLRIFDLNIEMGLKGALDLQTALDRALDGFKPDLTGISAIYYAGIPIFHAIAEIIKQHHPDSYVVLGGQYPSHLTEMSLEDDNIDFTVLSEGELGILALLEALDNGAPTDQVEGVALRKEGQVIKNERRSFWDGYGDTGLLDWQDLPMRHYFKGGRNVLARVKDISQSRFMSMTATRGCPNQCTFCSSKNFWRRRWRHRRIPLIIEEIKFFQRTHRVDTVIFNDENISVNRQWFYELLNEIEKLNITWISGGGLSVRTLTDENLVKKMYSSGIGLFNLAIESSSNEILNRIKKPSTVEEIRQVVSSIRTLGNGVIIGFFITGFPFETKADILRTYAFAEALDLDWKSFYCFQPFPGTDLYEYCKNNKLIEEFDINYGENYFSPQMKHIDYTAEELNRLNYSANLKCNFIDNRNLNLNTDEALDQAERDFRYVLDMAPNHVFALLGLARIMKSRNRPPEIKRYVAAARKALKDDTSFDWSSYLDQFRDNIGDALGEDNVI